MTCKYIKYIVSKFILYFNVKYNIIILKLWINYIYKIIKMISKDIHDI